MTGMDCDSIQKAILAMHAGDDLEVPASQLREHIGGCARCKSALPGIGKDWVRMNQALMPEPPAEFWQRVDARILGMARASAFAGLQAELTRFWASQGHMAADDPSSGREPDAVVHRLEVEGEELDVVIHTMDRGHVRLSIVDRKTRETSTRLDACEVALPSGRRIPIKDGGADIELHALLQEIGFSIVKRDGTVLRVREP